MPDLINIFLYLNGCLTNISPSYRKLRYIKFMYFGIPARTVSGPDFGQIRSKHVAIKIKKANN